MKRVLAVIAIFTSMISVSVASGHPGHGQDGVTSDFKHYLTEPVHLVSVLGTIVMCALLFTLLRRAIRPLPKTIA